MKPASHHTRHGRRKPYTEIGIARLPCYRCGARAEYQWQACADNRLHRPLCARCDVELNSLVLRWMGDPDAEAKVSRYAESRLPSHQLKDMLAFGPADDSRILVDGDY